jgi:hypothetical protein
VTVRTQARKVKKRIGPRLDKAILRILTDGVCYDAFLPVTVYINQPKQEKLGYLHLNHGCRANDISIYMSEGGRHE